MINSRWLLKPRQGHRPNFWHDHKSQNQRARTLLFNDTYIELLGGDHHSVVASSEMLQQENDHL